jgi:long-chain acyl-CoA synthetase
VSTGVIEKYLPLQSLYRWERERPESLFLTQPMNGAVRNWSWGEAGGEIRRMAAYLQSQGWAPGSQVAILSKNCAWWFMADLAIWMAGHVTVPVYPQLRATSVRQILDHSEAKACFVGSTEDKEAATLGTAGIERICFPNASVTCGRTWEEIVAETAPIAGNPTRDPEEVCTIFYTSGTTGVPKGVMHRFAMFAYQTDSFTRVLPLDHDWRVLSYLPLAHIVERAGLEMQAIQHGWHAFFSEGLDTFLTDLRRARPNMFLSVPRLLLKFQQSVFEKVPKKKLDRLLRIPLVGRLVGRKILRQLGLDQVRFAASGAAPLPVELLLWWRKLGLPLVEGFGLTESMITHLPKLENLKPGCVGTPLDCVEAIRSPQGELLMRSPMNMLGYFKDPHATEAAFTEDGFLRTGDVVEIDAGQQLKIIGRLKEQFKTSKGKYVAPAPIEAKLMAHPFIESCCLMGTGLPNPFAVLVLTPETRQRCADHPDEQKRIEASLEKRLNEVNAELDPHERVMFLVVAEEAWTVANGLLTPTLKMKRAVLEDRFLALVNTWKEQGRRVVWQGVPEAPAEVRYKTA